jgi:putative hemolysin
MKILFSFLVMALVMIAPTTGRALENPAAAYCIALGYEYSVEKSDKGEVGYCLLPNAQKVDAWQFLQGKVAQDKNYCATKGYGQKTVTDPKKCMKFLSISCLVCVLDDGREVEVTELMGLKLGGTTCGDGVCGISENHKKCPADCPSGSRDGYCDRVKDDKCDPDCDVREDPDCK